MRQAPERPASNATVNGLGMTEAKQDSHRSVGYQAGMKRRLVLATSLENPVLTISDSLYAEALRRADCDVESAPWEGDPAAFEGAHAVVLRATWNYYRALPAFRSWTERVAAATRLFNPIGLVRWNLRKDYVTDLAAAGVRVPLTWIVAGNADAVGAAMDGEGWSRAVVKPATGASGHGVELMSRPALAGQISALPSEAREAGLVVQEFLPEISVGELSMVYFDGVFSHAIRKRPPAGEFRTNSRFSPTRTPEIPQAAILEQGAACLRVLPELPLYARVDGVERDGQLIVIEVEVLEPALALETDPLSAERFARATLLRLG